MYVTAHASARLDQRLGWARTHEVLFSLEKTPGEPGTVAYVYPLGFELRADDGSNGDLLVVIAVDGSVETIYFRRSSQDISPEYFGARKVVRL